VQKQIERPFKLAQQYLQIIGVFVSHDPGHGAGDIHRDRLVLVTFARQC
jgi:hypothetical protein